MDTPPAITWLIPSLRSDAWLEESVLSALEQDFDDFEVLVVLDGGRLGGAEGWAYDSRVRVLELPVRRGLPHALNAGIEVAAAPLIARLDADDIAAPGRLRAQAAFLAANPDYVLVGSSYKTIDGDGVVTGLPHASRSEEDVRSALLRRNVFAHPSVMFRKYAALAAGGYSEDLQQMEDYELWLRMARQGKMANLAEPYISYRVHGDQMSRRTKFWQPYVWRVVRQRWTLGMQLGQSIAVQACREAIWLSVVFARSFGFRRRSLR